jgi:tetratricopeptide (TPR) repeat protein
MASFRVLPVAALLIACSAAGVFAQTNDRGVCGAVPPKSATIAACTRVIAAPNTSAHDRAMAYTFRADATRAGGDIVRAVNDYSEALTLLPDFTPALIGRGVAYRDGNDLVHAAADFDQAVKINPKDARALYERGLTKRKSGDTAGADADIAAAKAIKPDIAN